MSELSAPEHRFVVIDPQLLFTEGEHYTTLRFQLCEEKQPRRFNRSGKYIHLEIPNDAAMQLLGVLNGYRKHMGLPELTPTQARQLDAPTPRGAVFKKTKVVSQLMV